MIRKMFQDFTRQTSDAEEQFFTTDIFYDPYKEVFQWCILLNHREMGSIIWKYVGEAMPAALAACAILKEMTRYSKNQEEV